jgi:flagellar hook-associated protein 2
MGRIQSSIGLITGVAIEDTVNKLMELSSIPRRRLSSRNELLTKEQTAITSLTTLAIGVQLTTDRLGQANLFTSTKVTSSNASAISAQSTGSPGVGSYSFIPIRQAQSQQLTSSLFASATQTLSAGTITVHTGGFLDSSTQLDQLNGGAGVSRGFIRVIDRSGTSRDIDLRFAQTTTDVVQAINSAEGLKVVADVDGGQITLQDISGSSGNLKVEEVGSGTTARDLGLGNISVAGNFVSGSDIHTLQRSTSLRNLRDGLGLTVPSEGTALQVRLSDGSQVNFTTELDSQSANVGQLLDELNTAGTGKFQVSLASDGKSLEFQDLTSGSSSFSITSPSGDLAKQLGLTGAASGGAITGSPLLSGLNDTLLSSLNGGQGVGALGSIIITDRSGQSDTISLAGTKTLDDVLDALTVGGINADFRVQLNRTKTGIEIVDTSGGTGNLQIANADSTNSATALNIAASVNTSTIDSGSLKRQFVNANTSVVDLLNGQTLSKNSIRITDSSGQSSSLNLTTLKPESVGDVIDAINELGLGVSARINQSGDGLLLVDTAGGSGTLTVADVGSGNAAKQLRISGAATTQTVDGQSARAINGSRTLSITTTATTTLSDLAKSINELQGGPVQASVLSLGNSGVRLQLNGRTTGVQSRVAIQSTSGIEFSQTSEARDALISFGASESGGGVLASSSSNRFTGLVEDLDITIAGVSETTVSVEVTQTSDSIATQIQAFVDQYNSLRTKYDELTVFDAGTKQVGLLFGSGVALRIDQAYSRLLTTPIRRGPAGTIESLPELGVKLGENGKLTFDRDQFNRVQADNPEAVKDFFTNTTNGFSKRAKQVADQLAGVESGALLARNNTLQANIENNSSRIAAFDVRLEKERNRLLRQFYAMEQAISRLQNNLSSISRIQSVPASGR